MENKFKAVLFDMDGTLTDTERIYQKQDVIYWLLKLKNTNNKGLKDVAILGLKRWNF